MRAACTAARSGRRAARARARRRTGRAEARARLDAAHAVVELQQVPERAGRLGRERLHLRARAAAAHRAAPPARPRPRPGPTWQSGRGDARMRAAPRRQAHACTGGGAPRARPVLRGRPPPRCCRRRRAAARPRTSAPAPAPARAARRSAGRLRAARGRAAAERGRPPQMVRPCWSPEELHGGPAARKGGRRQALGRSRRGAPMLSTASRPSGRRECRSIRSSVPTAARPPSEFIQHCGRARVAASPLRALRACLWGTAALTMPNWREPANGLSYCIKPSSRPSAPASSVLNRIRYLRARRPGARSATARRAVPARLTCPARTWLRRCGAARARWGRRPSGAGRWAWPAACSRCRPPALRPRPLPARRAGSSI
jgi:hypothetical protein